MEHLLLGGVPPGDELHVVHEEHVCRAVLGPELLVLPGPDVPDELIGKVLTSDIDDLIVRVIFMDGVGDGIQQVGLAQAGLAVDEERVVVLCRMLGHSQGRCVGQLVGVAHHEALKGILLRSRQEAGGGFFLGVFVFFVLAQDHHVQVLGEQVVQGLFDVL